MSRNPSTASEVIEALSDEHKKSTINYNLQKLVKNGTITKSERKSTGGRGRAPKLYELSDAARADIDEKSGIRAASLITTFWKKECLDATSEKPEK